MDPHKNRIGNCESCLKMRFLVQIPEKCENANSNAKSFKNAKKNASISGKGLAMCFVTTVNFGKFSRKIPISAKLCQKFPKNDPKFS